MRVNYYEYIVSLDWKEKAREFRKRTKGCESCNRVGMLTIHHLNYECLGNEQHEDIQVLCWSCHKKRHLRWSTKEKDERWKIVKIELNNIFGKCSINF